MRTVEVKEELVHSTLDYTNTLIKKCGSRIPGTNGSLSAAHELALNMLLFCDETSEEHFTMHPTSLFHIGRIVSLAYMFAVALLFLGGYFNYLSLVLCLLVFSYAFIHFFLYGDFFDCLFQKRNGCNAVGILEPVDEVKQQVIVVGHHDSPYVFNFFTHLQRLAGIRFFLAMTFYLYITTVSLAVAIRSIWTPGVWHLSGALFVVALVGIFFTLPLYFFISTKASPGAGDNLNSSSIVCHTGKYFAERKKQEFALQKTRLILLSTDGEEAGQRGAIAYVKRHSEALHRIPTRVINIDSIYNLKDIMATTYDRHGFLPLSKNMAEDLRNIANKAGYHLKVGPLPFGSGTDAAAFAKAGIEAVGLIGLPTSLFEKDHIYHTMKDTVDKIEPEAVEAIFQMIIQYINKYDQAV